MKNYYEINELFFNEIYWLAQKRQPGREKVNSLPLLVFSVDYIYIKIRWSQLLSFKLIFNYQILIRFNSNISEMISNVLKENVSNYT